MKYAQHLNEAIQSGQSRFVLVLFYNIVPSGKRVYYHPVTAGNESGVVIPAQVEHIVKAFSSFSLKILEFANKSDPQFFNTVYINLI